MTRFKVFQSPGGLALRDTYSRQKPLIIDFIKLEQRLKTAGRRSELILQAVKPRAGLRVVDCTAGLGTDALILAYFGCDVTLIERSRVIAILLDDAIKRAMRHPDLSDVAARLHLICGEARSIISSFQDTDVFYLDPMFPTKTSRALVKGKMQLLQRFIGLDNDSAELIDMVISSGVKKTVLKRPPKDIFWRSPRMPDSVFASRNTKFEMYLR